MGFFSELRRSWKKSSQLRKLQLAISPPGRTAQDVIAGVMQSLQTGTDKRRQALEQFFDLCESDPGVRHVMEVEQLSRADLEEIYSSLQAGGLGQWIKGHYVALSTIAYVEPLLYTVRASRRGDSKLEIAGNLIYYWENKISQGTLLRRVQW